MRERGGDERERHDPGDDDLAVLVVEQDPQQQAVDHEQDGGLDREAAGDPARERARHGGAARALVGDRERQPEPAELGEDHRDEDEEGEIAAVGRPEQARGDDAADDDRQLAAHPRGERPERVPGVLARAEEPTEPPQGALT